MNSEIETENFGLKLAKNAHGGDLFTLTGDLGTGKTCFARGFARGLNVRNSISSPSFILMNVYPANKRGIKYLCHIDAYRVTKITTHLADSITEQISRKDTVTIIEWADKLEVLLKAFNKNQLEFKTINPTTRSITTTT